MTNWATKFTAAGLFIAVSILFMFPTFLGAVKLTSDSLFLEELVRKVSNGETSYNSWRLTTAPAYPDIIFYSISSIFTQSVTYRIAITACIQACTLIWVIFLFLRSALKTSRRIALFLSMFFVSWLVLLTGSSDLWVFFQSTNNHFSTILLGLLSLYVCNKFKETHKKRWLVAIFVITAVGLLSSSIHLISVVLPLTLMTLSVAIATKRRSQKPWSRFAIPLSLVLASIFYLLIRGAVIFNDALAGRVQPSLDAAANSASWYLKAALEVVIGGNPLVFITFFVTILAILSSVVDTWNVFSKPRDEFAIYLEEKSNSIFGLASFAITLVGSILSGGVVDIFAFRYLALPLLVLTLCAAAKIAIKYERVSAKTLLVLWALTLAQIGYITSLENEHESSAPPSGSAAACVVEAEKKYDLANGVANYWDARLSEYQLNWKHKIIPTLNNLEPFYWMSSSEEIATANSQKVNFVIVRPDSDPGPFMYSANFLTENMPTPTEIYDCKSSEYSLWIYSSSTLDDALSAAASQVLWREAGGKELTFSAGSMFSQVGKKSGQTTLLTNGQEGWLAFGPYFPLPEGWYVLRVYGKYLDSASDLAQIEVGQFAEVDSERFLSKSKLTLSGGYFEQTIYNTKFMSNFEMRVWVSQSTKLAIEKFQLQKL